MKRIALVMLDENGNIEKNILTCEWQIEDTAHIDMVKESLNAMLSEIQNNI